MVRIAIVEDDPVSAKKLEDQIKQFCDENTGGGYMIKYLLYVFKMRSIF
jgi:hypothetical protein